MFLNTGSGSIDIFEIKLTFAMLFLRGQLHSFSIHEWVFLWKCQSVWDRKCIDLRGTRTPNLRIHAKCSKNLSYQGQTFAVPCFWTLTLAVEIFLYMYIYIRNYIPYHWNTNHLFLLGNKKKLWVINEIVFMYAMQSLHWYRYEKANPLQQRNH